MTIVKHSIQMLFWRGVTIGLGVATSILLARLLGPNDRGTFAILVLSISLGTLIIQLGFPEALIYIVGSGEFTEKQIISTITVYMLSVIIILSVPSIMIMIYYLKYSLFKTMLLVVTASGLVLLSTLRHFILAHKQFNLYSLTIILESGIYLLGILIFWAVSMISVETVLFTYAASILLTFILLLLKQFPQGYSFSIHQINPQIIGKCFHHGFHLFIVGIGGFGMQRINYFLIELFAGTRSVGLFAAACTVPTLFNNLPQQLATVLYSYVANGQDEQYGMKITMMLIKIVAVVSILFMLPIVFFPESVVSLLFGKEFAGIGRALVILSAGSVFFGLGGIIFNSLAGIGLHRYGSYMTFINLTCITLLACLLIPSMGIEGAAWAQMLTCLLNLLFIITIFCKKSQCKIRALFVFSKSEIALIWSLAKKIVP